MPLGAVYGQMRHPTTTGTSLGKEKATRVGKMRAVKDFTEKSN